MSDHNAVALDVDGPHSPDYTKQVADTLAEAVRVLNYATRGADGLQYPSDVGYVLAALSQTASRLTQTCNQLAQFVTTEFEAGRVTEWAEGKHGGNAEAAVVSVRAALMFAGETAQELARHFDEAHASANGLEGNG